MRNRTNLRMLGIFLAFSLVAAACGDDSGSDETVAPNTTTTAAAAGNTTTTAAPATTTTEAPMELVEATLRLDWSYLVYHSPFLYAQEQGYYADEGIDLEILEGQGSGTTVTLVGTGEDTFGFADSGTTAVQKSVGVPVKNVLVVQRQSGFGTACYPDVGFSTPADLVGHSVAIVPVESTAQIWPAYLAANGIDESDVDLVNADFSNKVKLVADGQADCIAGYVAQDTLQAQLLNPELEDPIAWTNHGVALMGHGLVATESLIEDDPDLVAGFVRASIRGWEEVCADPQIGIDLFLRQFPELSAEDQEFTRQSMPFECADKLDPGPGDTGSRFGPTTDSMWQSMVDVLAEFGGLENPLAPSEYYTNDFVS